MSYLLDTHIFLWSILSSKKLSKEIKDILLDPEQTKIISAVTFWEISLKYQLGKLDLKNIFPDSLPTIAHEAGFKTLNLDSTVASSFYKLPKQTNKDPFDRMLAWHTICKDYILLTQDHSFIDYKKYGLKVVL